ncbi:hypothetical protein X801_08868 [Opisthorchis viverrini]|uniref:Magnesium transporter NIPA2 n=1 Tax=Opisthorchis viverrini TaxID=6198 RepID=A0A1S8WLL1_OPIVI|nr:hypothetical protein X801_08868 [Opisthorchis viverrini]
MDSNRLSAEPNLGAFGFLAARKPIEHIEPCHHSNLTNPLTNEVSVYTLCRMLVSAFSFALCIEAVVHEQHPSRRKFMKCVLLGASKRSNLVVINFWFGTRASKVPFVPSRFYSLQWKPPNPFRSLPLVTSFDGARVDDARASNRRLRIQTRSWRSQAPKDLSLEKNEVDGFITPSDQSCRIQKRLGDMVARPTGADERQEPCGLSLAISSTLLIGTGFIFKKRALLRAGAAGTRAGDGGLLYLRDWVWWIGLILLGLGEGANFVAYALAPAALVTPLGGLSVLVCAVLSARFLNEHLNLAGKLGCVVCLLGSTLIVLHAPKEQPVETLLQMRMNFTEPAFLIYASSVAILNVLLIFVAGPRIGKSNPLVYVVISASLGSISVMACKGLGLALREIQLLGLWGLLTYWFFWLLVILLAFGISIQLYFLNRALDIFNTGLVTALLYVFFTVFVLVASAILFHEWVTLKAVDYFELICGMLMIMTGVLMMTVLKNMNGHGRNPSFNFDFLRKRAPYRDSSKENLLRSGSASTDSDSDDSQHKQHKPQSDSANSLESLSSLWNSPA